MTASISSQSSRTLGMRWWWLRRKTLRAMPVVEGIAATAVNAGPMSPPTCAPLPMTWHRLQFSAARVYSRMRWFSTGAATAC